MQFALPKVLTTLPDYIGNTVFVLFQVSLPKRFFRIQPVLEVI